MLTCTCAIDRPDVFLSDNFRRVEVMHVIDALGLLEEKSVNDKIRMLVRSVKKDKLQSRWPGCHNDIPYSFTHTVFIHLVQSSPSPD